MSQSQFANQLAEKRAKLITDAQALLQGENVTAETRTKFDAMVADAKALGQDIERFKEAEALDAEMRSSVRPPLPTPGAANTDTAELRSQKEVAAFKGYLLSGEVSAENRSYVRFAPTEKRDVSPGMTEGNTLVAGTSGLVIPTVYRTNVEVALKSYGGALNVVSNLATDTGNPILYPIFNDTSNSSFIVDEANLIPENDIAFANKTLYVKKFSTGIVRVSKELLQDAAFDLGDFIGKAFAVRDARGVNSVITNGSADGLIDGIVPSVIASGNTVSSATGDISKISYADLVSLYAKIDPAYREGATWMWSNDTFVALLGMTDTLNRPLFIPSPTSGGFDSLLGKPVVFNQAMSDAAANKPAVLFGDFSKYIHRTALDLEVVKLGERYAEYGMVAFLGLSRHGGRYLNASAAGSGPIAALVQSAS